MCIIQLVQCLQKILKKGYIIEKIDDSLIDIYITILNKLKLIILLNNQDLILQLLFIIKDFASTKTMMAFKIFEEIKLNFLDY